MFLQCHAKVSFIIHVIMIFHISLWGKICTTSFGAFSGQHPKRIFYNYKNHLLYSFLLRIDLSSSAALCFVFPYVIENDGQ